ncbi:hypothetical protein, partial [Candidatus Parabeggiatoa sp. HSG14]|uniref:hypothetical protein n=1 Tax=Candidatus Parabeggiatoa sp. HSG14 TaxID=3055593 RepID=UPI0025A928A3|nr:hypothetical protein [Thiotrichales bacterium HSG14]
MKQAIRPLLWGCALALSSLPASAWQVSVQPDEADTGTSQVIVSNDKTQDNVNVYLAWLDLDATTASKRFLSWQFG